MKNNPLRFFLKGQLKKFQIKILKLDFSSENYLTEMPVPTSHGGGGLWNLNPQKSRLGFNTAEMIRNIGDYSSCTHSMLEVLYN